MDSILHVHSTPKSWLLDSHIAPYIDAYADHLKRGGLRDNNTHEHILCLAHLARWMRQSHCEVEEPDSQTPRYQAPDVLLKFLKAP